MNHISQCMGERQQLAIPAQKFPLPDIPSESEIRWLLQQGFSDKALMTPTLIRAANVQFLDSKTFDFDASGERAFVLAVEDSGVVIDLIAWESSRGLLATWRGIAFALGQDAIFNSASYFAGGALRIHASPFEWLRADREGVVIARPELSYPYLGNAPRLSFADPAHARTVKHWIEQPRPRAELFVEVPREKAAA